MRRKEIKEVLYSMEVLFGPKDAKVKSELIKYLMEDSNVNYPAVKNEKDIKRKIDSFFLHKFSEYHFTDIVDVFFTSPRLTGGEHLFRAMIESPAANRALSELRRNKKYKLR
tara:strand:+ start:115 stop:450 length:336 start_codon:yes stop_codon:yes gene_type:complete